MWIALVLGMWVLASVTTCVLFGRLTKSQATSRRNLPSQPLAAVSGPTPAPSVLYAPDGSLLSRGAA